MGRRIIFYFNAVMVLFYFAASAFFAFAPYCKQNLPAWERYSIASVFLLYAIYRAYYAYNKYKSNVS